MPKGQAEIISLLFLVTITVAVAIVFSTFQRSIFMIDMGVDSRIGSVEQTKFLRNAIFRCYGYPIEDNFTRRCNALSEYDGLQGWSINQQEFGYCIERELHSEAPEEYDNVLEYMVPIRENETVCPGILRMYI